MIKARGPTYKIVIIVISCGLLNFVLHGVLAPLGAENISFFSPSVFAERGWLVQAILVWEVLAFGVFASVFAITQKTLPGTRKAKGLLYGSAIAGLYVIGMLEMILLANHSVFGELMMGVTDGLTFVLAGLLLGLVIGTDSPPGKARANSRMVPFIAAVYVLGRYFAYSFLGVSSAYLSKPVGTFVWTMALGLWVGFAYYLLEGDSMMRSPLKQALLFGVVVFGSNWVMNHLFIYTVAEFSPDLLIRAGSDTIFTTTGVYLYRLLNSTPASQPQA